MLTRLSPAKINLALHMTGKRDDGFHFLDSLVVFTDIGDILTFTDAPSFSFTVDGPYASSFAGDDLGPKNLVVRAAEALGAKTNHPLGVHINLTKNLPLGSGIGGGSSNAATTLAGLADLWGLQNINLHNIATTLGSDVAVCLPPHTPKQMQGIGDIILPINSTLPPLNILLVNPNIPCPTPAVYKTMKLREFSNKMGLPARTTPQDFIAYLRDHTHNDMTEAAIATVPTIATILDELSPLKGCLLSRLSGSGATCFGLFEDHTDINTARDTLAASHPDWWIKTSNLVV